MTPIGNFTDEISLTPLRGREERWRVNDSFAWHVGELGSRYHVVVPKGFIYDLASVPMLARPVVPHTTAPQASALHDFGYRINAVKIVKDWEGDTPIYFTGIGVPMPRKFWDKQFLDAMIALDVHPFRASAAYNGVRAGGWVSWRGHRKNDGRV